MNWRQSRLFNLHIREIRGAVSPFIVAVRTDPGAKLQPALGAKRVSMGELMLTPIAHEDVVTIFPTVARAAESAMRRCDTPMKLADSGRSTTGVEWLGSCCDVRPPSRSGVKARPRGFLPRRVLIIAVARRCVPLARSALPGAMPTCDRYCAPVRRIIRLLPAGPGNGWNNIEKQVTTRHYILQIAILLDRLELEGR